MSLFRKVWADAISANQELALTRSKGEAAFQRLIETYPDDGMVYYERGEAYEYLKEFDKAESDYQTAENLFPLKHWKAVAHEGSIRVKHLKQSPAGQTEVPQDMQIAIIHRIHTVPQLPHDIRVDALSAAQKFDAEPHFAAAQLRSCLEQLVITILNNAHINYPAKSHLDSRLTLLKSRSIVPSEIADRMNAVRDLGNEGIHKGKTKKPIDFRPSLFAFADIVEWYGSSRLWQK